MKLDVSGQSDQEVDVWGHLRDSPAETCAVGPSGLPDFHYALLDAGAAGPGKHVVCSLELWVCRGGAAPGELLATFSSPQVNLGPRQGLQHNTGHRLRPS